MTENMTLRQYEFIAAPAHTRLWCVARFLGGRFECALADEFDEDGYRR